jgi:acyl-CoA thioester hydrolase
MTGAAAPRVCTSELRVRYAETDQMGVVYHANYLIWCDIGRTDFIRELGTPYAEMERQGVALAVTEAVLRYHGAARYDERIRIETRLVDVRSRTVAFDYRIANADTGARLASASTVLVSIDGSGRAAAMPEAIRRLLEAARS